MLKAKIKEVVEDAGFRMPKRGLGEPASLESFLLGVKQQIERDESIADEAHADLQAPRSPQPTSSNNAAKQSGLRQDNGEDAADPAPAARKKAPLKRKAKDKDDGLGPASAAIEAFSRQEASKGSSTKAPGQWSTRSSGAPSLSDVPSRPQVKIRSKAEKPWNYYDPASRGTTNQVPMLPSNSSAPASHVSSTFQFKIETGKPKASKYYSGPSTKSSVLNPSTKRPDDATSSVLNPSTKRPANPTPSSSSHSTASTNDNASRALNRKYLPFRTTRHQNSNATQSSTSSSTSSNSSNSTSPAPHPQPPTFRNKTSTAPITGANGFRLLHPQPIFKRGTNGTAMLTMRYVERGNPLPQRITYAARGALKHRAIDWHSDADISRLNNWACQFLRRKGCASLRGDMQERVWQEEEVEWLRREGGVLRGERVWGTKGAFAGELARRFNEVWEGREVGVLKGGRRVVVERGGRSVQAVQTRAEKEGVMVGVGMGGRGRRGEEDDGEEEDGVEEDGEEDGDDEDDEE